jgi:hypothetical protein
MASKGKAMVNISEVDRRIKEQLSENVRWI